MVSIAAAVQRIKDDPHAAIEPAVAESVCRELGLEWKDTPLTPPITIALLAQQVLAGNVSNPELIRRQGLKITPAAYCTAKGRVPPEAIQQISRRVCDAAQRAFEKQPEHLWKGHRTWHMDGSSHSMPDTPELQERYGQPGNQKPGCGFPVAHLLCLFGALTGLIREVIISALRTHDLAVAPQTHGQIRCGDIVIADTAFGSFFHIVMLASAGVLAVFPSHQKRIVSFRRGRKHRRPRSRHGDKGLPTSRWLRCLGKHDQWVEYLKPDRPRWMDVEQYRQMPDTQVVREIRRTIRRQGFRPLTVTIVTTLLDAERYPAGEIVELSARRWAVEVNLRHLKTTMKMEVLHTQRCEGIERELWTFVLIYNLVRVIMMEAARRQQVPLDRISFADALYWMRHAQPHESLPDLIVNPHRPNRVEPRAVKRRPKEYDRLTAPRAVLRKRLKTRA
jgi:hypothetical protein